MDGINIDDLTIEQYLMLTQEHRTPSMVKKVDDMTIAEYVEHEERIKRQYSRNSGSYFPTYFDHYTSSNNTTLEFPRNTYFNPIIPNTKFNYDSKDMELDEEVGYTTDEESVMSEHEAIDPVHAVNIQSFEEELSSEEDLDEWLNAKMEKHMSMQEEKNDEDALIAIIKSIREKSNIDAAAMSVEMDHMKQQETLGTVKNVLVKTDKFEFLCDLVVIDMPENLGEMIILGRPFLETIHAQIDVFQEEISLGIGKDRIKFDVNGNPRRPNITIEKIYMENTSQKEESFNPLEIGHDLFSYKSPACLQFEQDTRNYDTIDPQNEITGQTNLLLDKGGFTKIWHVCKPVQVFYDDGSDFFQVRYENQRIDDTTRERRYYEWVAQNYEFDNNKTPSTTTVSDKCPYKTNYPTPILLDEWETRCHITYTEVKIGHTNIYDYDREIVFNEWILDNFDVEEEYAKEIGNLYSRRFDEYKRVFDNEVENLSNEYTLRVGKKGYVVDDVWEICEQYHKNVINSWHDVGYEEEELWRSEDEKLTINHLL
ncbi:hypothetical protein Tco_1281634 [Tanacetum coccineum]